MKEESAIRMRVGQIGDGREGVPSDELSGQSEVRLEIAANDWKIFA